MKTDSQLYRVITASFAILAGVLDLFNGFALLPFGSLANEWVYVLTDFSILMLLVGLLGITRSELTAVGFLDWFLAFFGFAFITGPSALIGGVDAYSIGTSFIGLGFVLLSISLVQIEWIPQSFSLMLTLTVLVSVLGVEIDLMGYSVVLSNVILGLAFIELGLSILCRNCGYKREARYFTTHH